MYESMYVVGTPLSQVGAKARLWNLERGFSTIPDSLKFKVHITSEDVLNMAMLSVYCIVILYVTYSHLLQVDLIIGMLGQNKNRAAD